MKQKFLFTAHHDLLPKVHPALQSYVSELSEIIGKEGNDYPTPAHALRLPLDTHVMDEIAVAAKRYSSPRLKYVIVIGIGGSMLGTKAVYDALCGKDGALSSRAKLFFLETLSVSAIVHVSEMLMKEAHASDEFLINLVSKSGTTMEPVVNFELLYQALQKRFSDIATRVVCTTDVGSALWTEGTRLGCGLLPVPTLVGGRYSVFSAVGLFPLFLAGVDVEGFRDGGRDMLHAVISFNERENYATRSAEEIFAALVSGCNMFNIFHFTPELESLGKWERQLIAESIGKEKDIDGKIVHAGITPIVSIGSSDLHSMAQLFLGGPRDKFTMFVRANDPTDMRVHSDGVCAKLAGGAISKTPSDIMDAILGGTMGAYEKHGLPFSEVRLPAISSYTLGLYMEWRMATVIYLAKLMNVDAFNQPNVEDYKKVTREILNQVGST